MQTKRSWLTAFGRVLLVTTATMAVTATNGLALGCAAPLTEDESNTGESAFTASSVVDPARVKARFYIHSNIYHKRRFGFDVELGAVLDHFSSYEAATAKAFVLVPKEDTQGNITWERHDFAFMDATSADGKVVHRYRGSAGAELFVNERTKPLGVAFGLDTNGGTLWMQAYGKNTRVEEGGEGLPLDGSLRRAAFRGTSGPRDTL